MKLVSSIAFFAVFLAVPLEAKDHVVSQKGKAFAPEEVSIVQGDTIVFKNDDDTAHNVFASSDGLKFNLGIQKQGSESKHAFEEAGEFVVRCAIHPKMKLKVVVAKK